MAFASAFLIVLSEMDAGNEAVTVLVFAYLAFDSALAVHRCFKARQFPHP
jgi:hypothetical protein